MTGISTGRNPRSGYIRVKAKLPWRWLSPVIVWTAQFGSMRSFRDSGSFHFNTLHPLDVVLNCKVEMRSQWPLYSSNKSGEGKESQSKPFNFMQELQKVRISLPLIFHWGEHGRIWPQQRLRNVVCSWMGIIKLKLTYYERRGDWVWGDSSLPK